MASFMKAIYDVDLRNFEQIESIHEAVEERYDELTYQEPDYSYEYFYEKWEEKFSEFEYLRDEFEDLYEDFKEVLLDDNGKPVDEYDKEEIEDLKKYYMNWVLLIERYQKQYGGLKRLAVYF